MDNIKPQPKKPPNDHPRKDTDIIGEMKFVDGKWYRCILSHTPADELNPGGHKYTQQVWDGEKWV